MIQIECGNCQRRLRVPVTAAGKRVPCPCGEKLVVSDGTNAAVKAAEPVVQPKQEATGSFSYSCDCGRSLRVAQYETPKKAKCPCGNMFVVPAKPVQASQPPQKRSKPVKIDDANAGIPRVRAIALNESPAPVIPILAARSAVPDWTRELPPPPMEYAPNAGYIPQASTADYSRYSIDANSSANDYLKNAVSEKRKSVKGNVERPTMFGSSVLYGGAMMLGAIVWFVVGLYFDRIFFYPPVMFVLGLIGLVRGLLDAD